MLNKWVNIPVQSTSNVATEYRYDSGFVPLPDGASMFFEGGSNDNIYKIANKTVTYNAGDDTWHVLPEFNDPKNGGYRQM
jgi:hypothetical protein